MILLVLLVFVWASVSLGADIVVTVNPEHEDQAFGSEMAPLGDVNADGYDDFLVIDANQSGPGYRGRAYVYFGGPGVDSCVRCWTTNCRPDSRRSPGKERTTPAMTFRAASSWCRSWRADAMLVR